MEEAAMAKEEAKVWGAKVARGEGHRPGPWCGLMEANATREGQRLTRIAVPTWSARWLVSWLTRWLVHPIQQMAI